MHGYRLTEIDGIKFLEFADGVIRLDTIQAIDDGVSCLVVVHTRNSQTYGFKRLPDEVVTPSDRPEDRRRHRIARIRAELRTDPTLADEMLQMIERMKPPVAFPDEPAATISDVPVKPSAITCEYSPQPNGHVPDMPETKLGQVFVQQAGGVPCGNRHVFGIPSEWKAERNAIGDLWLKPPREPAPAPIPGRPIYLGNRILYGIPEEWSVTIADNGNVTVKPPPNHDHGRV